MKKTRLLGLLSCLAFCCLSIPLTGQQVDWEKLQTAAEKSGFTATCKHADLIDFQNQLARAATHVTNLEIGKTVNGRSMQATLIAKPAYKLGDQTDSRLVVLLLGNIHSGECAGKEGLLMLLRELARNAEHPWLKNLVVVCLPNYNADGNDRIGRNEIHRPGQIGPTQGMGLRENAQQLDLNRDFMKLESPEARSLVRLINRINPHLFIDCHTTNGSRHRYHLTYDIPHNPTAPAPLRSFLREQMMPQVTSELLEKEIPTFYYGNFSRDQSRWTTYGHEPRYSTEYVGLRGRLSILSEAYSYISYEDRIVASREFVRACVNYVSQNAEQVKSLLKQIEKSSSEEEKKVSLAAEVQPFEEKFTLLGYEGGTTRPKDVEVEFYGKYVSTRSRNIPSGYLIAAKHGRVVDRLLMHGIRVNELSAAVELNVEEFTVTSKVKGREFQKHQMLKLEGDWTEKKRKFPAGTYYISTGQPLGSLAAYLLEPESNDGLVTWNFFDSTLELQSTFPVFSLVRKSNDLPLTAIDQVQAKRQLTLDELYGLKGKIDFGGNSSPEIKWTDSNRYQAKWNGRTVIVDAESGNLERLPSASNRALVAKLMKQLDLTMPKAEKVAAGERTEVGSGVVLNNGQDLYWVSLDSDQAKRLTSDEPKEELVGPSPDKRQIAFVKNNDLYRIEIQSGKVTRVTDDGSENLLNGKLDWVYQEELYGRGNFKGYWWSPDSKSLAYLTLDQSKVKRYQVTDNIPLRQSHEVYPYPKAGDPNPTVSISIDGQKLNLNAFSYREPLISQVCWSPDGAVLFQFQNRIQNEMNLISWKPGQSARILVTEKTDRGWLDSPGNPIWVDGLKGFLWFTHRNGRRQIAQYSDTGQLMESPAALTHPLGEKIEVRELIGATADAVYFMAANPSDLTRQQLYKLEKDGRSKMITDVDHNHSVVASPSLEYFFDFASQLHKPTQVALRRMDGSFIRYVEPNLVDYLDYYNFSQPIHQRVPTRDGDLLDSFLILPPDFDDSQKYPVIMHVYSGPQAPRVRNRWGGASFLWHQMMAQKGFVIWMCDNRSATHAGMDVSYPIYRDLGRRELRDIEDSLNWLKKKNWVDGSRIGIWGWSYGGYMTAYAMTHSKLFKAGISGAPVTDWRNYDSIYTERYMGLPKDNAQGYDDSSVVKAAADLNGRMLIIHGTQDDNVHISNTYQLAEALQKAGKLFDLMIYPKNRHGIRVPAQTLHLRKVMTQFFIDHL